MTPILYPTLPYPTLPCPTLPSDHLHGAKGNMGAGAIFLQTVLGTA